MHAEHTQVLVVHRNRQLEKRLRDQSDSFSNVEFAFAPGTGGLPLVLPDQTPDVIVLDLTVPVPPGFHVYRVIHSRTAMAPPVLILRAKGSRRIGRGARERWRLSEGIEAVETSLQIALGRTPHQFAWLPLRFSGSHLVADLPNTHVTVDGRRVAVTAREAELLGLLLARRNELVRRELLFSEIWGYETRSLDVHVRRLRRKLGLAGKQIETVASFGYRFVEPDVSAAIA